MFWADELVKDRQRKEWINDAWTPSGIVHMGGLKGPVIHDTLFRILKENGTDVKYTFGFDDFDPIDGLPLELEESHKQYMGIPVFIAPSPDGNGSFGEFYSNKMRVLFQELGIEAEIYLASDYYKKGVYNKAITFVLDHAEKIRKVYEEMYKKSIAQDWHPLQVICPKCGKLGTTKVIGWDGKEVSFICEPQLVRWAAGCGTTGKLSPFDGNAKMPFKVEWAAKWWTFGVTIEGAGKDHASAGGTYDVARKICKDVFGQEPPLKIPYEFFLSEGKKMSSSKGLGLTGEDLLEILAPEVARFLMIKTEPNRAVEFEPKNTLIIPKLYDDYDQARREYNRKADSDFARAFTLSQIQTPNPSEISDIPSFDLVTKYVQMPNVDISAKFLVEKDWKGIGVPGSFDYRKQVIEDRERKAMVWVEKYAPESDKFLVQKKLPDVAKDLSEEQKAFLHKIAGEIGKKWDPEDFQTKIYEVGKELGMNGKQTFAAIYLSLIGKDHGPKAAWLILSLDKEFVKTRFQEIS